MITLVTVPYYFHGILEIALILQFHFNNKSSVLTFYFGNIFSKQIMYSSKFLHMYNICTFIDPHACSIQFGQVIL